MTKLKSVPSSGANVIEFKAKTARQVEPQQDNLFDCNIKDCSIKDDIASMEVAIFSLSKRNIAEVKERKYGERYVRVASTVFGAATVFDKDLLLYAASQIIEARNQGKQVSRAVKIDSIDFLRKTKRGDGRKSFENILNMLRRLKGTMIETNIPTNGLIQTKGFGLIDEFEVLSKKEREDTVIDPKTGKSKQITQSRVLSFTVTLSEWLFHGLLNYEILTLDPKYFALTRSIERRLYEIARKHCGDKVMWKINIDLLMEKIGIAGKCFRLRDDLRQVMKADRLPEYQIALDTKTTPNNVVFYTRDKTKLSNKLSLHKKSNWFYSLEHAKKCEFTKVMENCAHLRQILENQSGSGDP
jgi:plasmid replication initiation protein